MCVCVCPADDEVLKQRGREKKRDRTRSIFKKESCRGGSCERGPRQLLLGRRSGAESKRRGKQMEELKVDEEEEGDTGGMSG